MEGVLALMPFKEVPIKKSNGPGSHPLVKLQQLRRRIRQVFQNVEADHRIETNIARAAEIAMHRELVRQPQALRPLLNKSLAVGIEVDKPDVIDLRQRRRRKGVGADATVNCAQAKAKGEP